MYTGRTHKTGRNSVLSIAVLFTALLAAAPTHAQNGTSGRLSSNPNDLRDSFAKHSPSVDSPKAFAAFVAQNPVLGQRYARHFGVPQERLVSFFQNALVPHSLSQAQMMTTFGVNKNGAIYPVKTNLPAGTKVWATREGVPVLKWNCSNPLSTLLPGPNLNTNPVEYATTASSVLPSGSPVLDVPDSTFSVASGALPGDAEGLALAPPLPSLDFGVPSTVAGSAALPGIGEIIEAGSSSIEDLWPALFLPVIFAATQGGGSDVGFGETPPLLLPVGETGGTPGAVLPPGGVVVVPEGNTALLVLGGLPILGLALKMARRNKK